MDTNSAPKLYRKRYIPDETVYLKKDQILLHNDEVLVTKWVVLNPREDFVRGLSCYYLKKGFKISRFIDKSDNTLYYYCDIINTEYDLHNNSYLFTDLLVDVIVYESGFVKVMDIGEVVQALDSGLIDIATAKSALVLLDELLGIIYAGNFGEYTKYLTI